MPESSQFKDDLERLLLIDWEIETLHGGKISLGFDWAHDIRTKIKKSKLVVADVTDTSREVMFEIGFAGNKPALYVTARHADRATLPPWLTIRQSAAYLDDGTDSISRTIGGFIRSKNLPVLHRRSVGPGSATLLMREGHEWAVHTAQFLEARLGEFGVALKRVDPEEVSSGVALSQIASSQLIFACIDGSRSDYLAHFALGAVAGRPSFKSFKSQSPGGSQQTLRRIGVVLSQTQDDFEAFAADALKRIDKDVIFRSLEPSAIDARILPVLKKHRQWRARGRGDLS
ncbi:hypothetical protein ACQEVI_20045 [Promicromonospora sp. CA-289599]|uniref:hypothetical protein n=1 Tax=Promicromonospora sp. CA-289599 TaxID=3240014 RepID=UPI003D903C43